MTRQRVSTSRPASKPSWPVRHRLLQRDLAKAAGRAVNLAVAEWAIRRRPILRRLPPVSAQSPAGAPS